MLSTKTYRDNNNFVNLNSVTTRDERLNFLAGPRNFTFVDISTAPPWVSNHMNHKILNTTTDGITYKDDTVDMLYGTYFFLSYTRTEHTR